MTLLESCRFQPFPDISARHFRLQHFLALSPKRRWVLFSRNHEVHLDELHDSRVLRKRKRPMLEREHRVDCVRPFTPLHEIEVTFTWLYALYVRDAVAADGSGRGVLVLVLVIYVYDIREVHADEGHAGRVRIVLECLLRAPEGCEAVRGVVELRQ